MIANAPKAGPTVAAFSQYEPRRAVFPRIVVTDQEKLRSFPQIVGIGAVS
jgi:hypothetical protein